MSYVEVESPRDWLKKLIRRLQTIMIEKEEREGHGASIPMFGRWNLWAEFHWLESYQRYLADCRRRPRKRR